MQPFEATVVTKKHAHTIGSTGSAAARRLTDAGKEAEAADLRLQAAYLAEHGEQAEADELLARADALVRS